MYLCKLVSNFKQNFYYYVTPPRGLQPTLWVLQLQSKTDTKLELFCPCCKADSSSLIPLPVATSNMKLVNDQLVGFSVANPAFLVCLSPTLC